MFNVLNQAIQTQKYHELLKQAKITRGAGANALIGGPGLQPIADPIQTPSTSTPDTSAEMSLDDLLEQMDRPSESTTGTSSTGAQYDQADIVGDGDSPGGTV